MKCPWWSLNPPGTSVRFSWLEKMKIAIICAIGGPQIQRKRRGPLTSAKEYVHHPAEAVGSENQPTENAGGETPLRARVTAQQRAEDGGDAGREQNHHPEVCRHADLRPRAKSTASSTTSELRMPATMRNVLPY